MECSVSTAAPQHLVLPLESQRTHLLLDLLLQRAPHQALDADMELQLLHQPPKADTRQTRSHLKHREPGSVLLTTKHC